MNASEVCLELDLESGGDAANTLEDTKEAAGEFSDELDVDFNEVVVVVVVVFVDDDKLELDTEEEEEEEEEEKVF